MSKTSKMILSVCILLFSVVLIFNFVRTNANEDEQTAISNQEAIEIALDYLGVGTANDAVLITENDTPIYEVEIEADTIKFLVYVHATTGDVIRMNRFEEGYEGITTLPEVIPPDELEVDAEE